MQKEPYAPNLPHELTKRFGIVRFGEPTAHQQNSAVNPQFGFVVHDIPVSAGENRIGICSLHSRDGKIIGITYQHSEQFPVVQRGEEGKPVVVAYDNPVFVWSPERGREDGYARDVKFP